jgi:trans-aconitate methyltransferase
VTTTFADWLALREPADAAARSTELVDRLPLRPPLVVHDLGSGTGSMLRWLAPRLRARVGGTQHWVLYDRNPRLLAGAVADLPLGVTAEARLGDLGRLSTADLAGASLVTASALLDVLTADEIHRLVAACAKVPTLLTLTVVGGVALDPPDPADAAVAAAFNAHQRRAVGRRRLAGPDAVHLAMAAFRSRRVRVESRETPWRLVSGQLAEAWFSGWVTAALEQQPALSVQLNGYVRTRLAQLALDRLTVSVRHRDLLALESG